MNTIRIRKADFTIGEAISHGEFGYTIDGLEHFFAITGGAPHAYRITHMGTGSLFVKMPEGCGDLIDRAMLCVELVVARYGEGRVAAGIARAPVLPEDCKNLMGARYFRALRENPCAADAVEESYNAARAYAANEVQP